MSATRRLLIPLCAVDMLLAGCSVLKRIASDSATRLAYEIRDEAK
jgi:hypothetical protein